eukprot:gnl/Trimastix_PCT/4078.p1 GENE.gnl/Trimastix_PCT/4078~~gnl/Trimastix_PCT/4078.p1  ORF type:complete len:257 (+),score=15.09 gnl/Trimastix_PCT/4078:47-817(+)
MTTLTSFPREILSHILSYLVPSEILSLGHVCRHFAHVVFPGAQDPFFHNRLWQTLCVRDYAAKLEGLASSESFQDLTPYHCYKRLYHAVTFDQEYTHSLERKVKFSTRDGADIAFLPISGPILITTTSSDSYLTCTFQFTKNRAGDVGIAPADVKNYMSSHGLSGCRSGSFLFHHGKCGVVFDPTSGGVLPQRWPLGKEGKARVRVDVPNKKAEFAFYDPEGHCTHQETMSFPYEGPVRLAWTLWFNGEVKILAPV